MLATSASDSVLVRWAFRRMCWRCVRVSVNVAKSDVRSKVVYNVDGVGGS